MEILRSTWELTVFTNKYISHPVPKLRFVSNTGNLLLQIPPWTLMTGMFQFSPESCFSLIWQRTQINSQDSITHRTELCPISKTIRARWARSYRWSVHFMFMHLLPCSWRQLHSSVSVPDFQLRNMALLYWCFWISVNQGVNDISRGIEGPGRVSLNTRVRMSPLLSCVFSSNVPNLYLYCFHILVKSNYP